MYDHVGLKVKNVAASARFYAAALGPLGHVVSSQDISGAGIGPSGEPALWLYRDSSGDSSADTSGGSPGAGVHMAFRASDRTAVDRFHQEGLSAGGKDNGRPGLRTDYSPTYYAAFLIDPDGNNVEVVCLR